MGAFDVVALRGICANYFESHVRQVLQDLRQAQERLEERLEVVLQDNEAVTAREQREQERDRRLEELVARVVQLEEQQAATSAAKAEEQEEERGEEDAEEEQEQEDEAEAFVTASQLDELVSRVDELEAKCRALDDELQRKANTRDVATLSQFQKLSTLIKKVPSIVQMQELSAAVERKVDASLVPTLSEVRELSAALERKADARTVPTVEQYQKLSAALELKADRSQVTGQQEGSEEVRRLALEMAQKANSQEVATMAQMEEHAAVVERKLAFLATKVQRLADTRDKERMCQPVFWYAPQMMAAAPATTSWEEVSASSGSLDTPEGWQQGSASAHGGQGPQPPQKSTGSSGSDASTSSAPGQEYGLGAGPAAPGMWWSTPVA